jgi:amidohydrolase
MNLDATLQDTIAQHEPALIELRRRLHRQPELSAQEFATTQVLAEELRRRGLEVHVRPEGTGLYADLAPANFDPQVHPTVALRCDIDALPILEETGLSYCSERAGVMHACGHDMHMACAMGATVGLWSIKPQLPGRIRLICQHNEESLPGGADEMVAFGAMQGVDYVLATHCDPELEVGTVGLRAGPLTAAADLFELTIEGQAGHSARPHHSVDPIFVASQVAVALYQSFGRLLDARDPVVLAIGAIHAGDAHNIIPATAHLRGTVRTLSKTQRQRIKETMHQIIDGVCATWGARASLLIKHGSPAVINHAGVVDTLRDVAREVVGDERIYEIPLPSMGGEDFSEYLEQAPGAMFRLGTAHSGQRHMLHSPFFNPDEGAIRVGATMMARAALALLQGKAHKRP